MQRIGPLITCAVTLLWLAGQLLKDRTWWTGLLFYLPTPVLTSWLLLLIGISIRKRSPGWKINAPLIVLPLVFLCSVENHWTRDASPVGKGVRLRLVHWNLCRTVMGWDEQRRQIEALNPDIIVLSETSADVHTDDFPGFQVLRIHGMLIASRGPMTASEALVSGGALNAFQIQCEPPTGTINVMIADMTSNLNVHRDRYLQRLLKVLEDRMPDLVVGDFNAPRRSRAFTTLPAGFRHAYDAAGFGWSYTWPVPVPFLAIDQCIFGRNITAINYQLQSTRLSDHRIQILDFQL